MADRETLELIREMRTEMREEAAITRAAYAEQLDLTRTVVARNGEAFFGLVEELARFRASNDALRERIDAFGERIDAFGERVDAFGERIDAFGETLDLQREVLLRFLDRLDEGQQPPQG